MNEQVFTITTSACAVSLVISTPSFSSVPTITSASTRFFAQPSEIIPTRTGRFACSFIKDRLSLRQGFSPKKKLVSQLRATLRVEPREQGAISLS